LGTAVNWFQPLPMAMLLAPVVGVLAPKGLAPLIFALGAWGWLTAWRAVLARPPLLLLAIAGIVALLDLWALASLAWTPAPADALLSWINVTAVALALPPLLRAPVDRTARRALVIGVVAALLLMLAQRAVDYAALRWAFEFLGKDFEKTETNRRLVNLLLLAWPAALLLARHGKAWLAAGALLATVLAVLAGVSNSAQLAAVAAVPAALAGFALPRAVPPALAAVAVLGVLAAPVAVPALLAPARFEGTVEDRYYSSLHRLYIWEFASQRIAERPLAGWGYDAAPQIPGGDAKLPHGGNRMNMHPHNGTLQVWLELGGIGAVLWAALLVAIAWSLRCLRGRWAPALAAGQLVAALLVVHLSFGIWQTAWLAALGLAAVAMRVASEVRQRDQPGG
jgi:O-antigen ligase